MKFLPKPGVVCFYILCKQSQSRKPEAKHCAVGGWGGRRQHSRRRRCCRCCCSSLSSCGPTQTAPPPPSSRASRSRPPPHRPHTWTWKWQMINLIEICPALQQKILPPVKLSDCEIRPKTEARWWMASMQTKCTWVVIFRSLCYFTSRWMEGFLKGS